MGCLHSKARGIAPDQPGSARRGSKSFGIRVNVAEHSSPKTATSVNAADGKTNTSHPATVSAGALTPKPSRGRIASLPVIGIDVAALVGDPAPTPTAFRQEQQRHISSSLGDVPTQVARRERSFSVSTQLVTQKNPKKGTTTVNQ